MSNITLNIVEPGSAPVVPDTGLFTAGIGGPEATIITAVSTVLLLTIVAVVVAMLYKKHKKQGKATKLINTVDACATVVKSKKRVSAGLAAVALLVSAGTFAALLVNAGKSNTNAAEGEDGLTLDISSEDLTIEVGSEPVFAVLPVEITVEEETPAGYTLTAYTDSTNLVSTTDSSKVIPMVAVEGDELISLTDNTYGLSLVQPETKDDEAYTSLSTDQDNPTFITDKDFEHTDPNDTATIYYGFYITPDVPYGTYTGSGIYYEAIENTATVIYDGNGLYFNGNESQTTNIVKYIQAITTDTKKYAHTANINDNGEVSGTPSATNQIITIPGATTLHIDFTYGGGLKYSYLHGFASFWQGPHADYTPDGNYKQGIQRCGNSQITDGRYYSDNGTKYTVECDILGDTVTFGYSTYGGPSSPDYGYYAVVTGYDADGNIIYLPGNSPVIGDYLEPSSDTYYEFLGWSKSKDATEPTYITEEDIATKLSLTPGTNTALYAVWAPNIRIVYDGNGAESTTNMKDVVQYAYGGEQDLIGKQVGLLASNFTKEGYGFVGWSTDTEAWDHLTNENTSDDPTIYGPNQTITIDESLIAEAGENRRLILNAVWAPAEKDDEGNPISLQNWTGCSNLTATTYDSQTGTLTVGANTITALTDNRDGNVYTIARLADGNCWMTENLRLDNSLTNASTTEEFSASNTNNPSLPLANNYTDQITSNRLSVSLNSWCIDYGSAACYDQSIINTNNIVDTAVSPSFSQDFTSSKYKSFDVNVFSYGAYYNWYSATAGNGKYETSRNVTVAGDVCPAGWQLPYGGDQNGGEGQNKGNTNGGFYYLNQRMGKGKSTSGSNNWRSFPNNFVDSGYWYYFHAIRDSGYYWSSTASSTGEAFSVYLNAYDVSPGTNFYGKYAGYAVRCLALGQ